MHVSPTALPGVLVIEPKVWADARGFFFESFHADRFRQATGLDTNFVQDNHSRSQCGILRGLHYQLTCPQTKLCRVVQGEVLDVAVDIRRGSPTFGKWVSVLLSADNKRQILVPRGFAHGFVVLSDTAEFLYKCDDFYRPEDERGIAWNDPDIGIDWQLPADYPPLLLSGKDQRNPRLCEVAADDLPVYSEP